MWGGGTEGRGEGVLREEGERRGWREVAGVVAAAGVDIGGPCL